MSTDAPQNTAPPTEPVTEPVTETATEVAIEPPADASDTNAKPANGQPSEAEVSVGTADEAPDEAAVEPAAEAATEPEVKAEEPAPEPPSPAAAAPATKQEEEAEPAPEKPATLETRKTSSVESPAAEATAEKTAEPAAETPAAEQPAAPEAAKEATEEDTAKGEETKAEEPRKEIEEPSTATDSAESAEAEPDPDAEAPPAEGELSHEDMEQLLNEYTQEGAPETGEIKPATVVNVTGDGIVVSLGLKQEGIVPLAEFTDDAGEIKTKAGDKFDVLVEASHATQGFIPCSADGAYRLRLWEFVEEAASKKEKVKIKVTTRTKGGFEVDLLFPIKVPGHRPLSGFIPGSQMDIRPVRHWEGFLNRQMYAQIIRFNRRRGNIVLSRREMLEEEHAERKKLLDETLVEGAVIEGEVKNMTDYGAFVDIGGLDGLLHITDISHKRLGHPSEMLKPGQKITVKVLKVDKKKERVSLGMKQTEPDPWDNVGKKYKIGERVKGRVTHMLDFGAFVELEPGVEGMIHVTEMSWTKKVRRPSDILNEGDWVEAAVLDFQPKDKRLSLGLRQTEADPFQAVAERYPPGSIIEGPVTSMTDFGAFVEVEPGIEGMIHQSELAWGKKSKKPKSMLKKGATVKVKVIKVDVLARRLSLSLKDLSPDPTATFLASHKTGDIVKGKVTRRTDFGVFAEVADGVEGLCHISELPRETKGKDEIKVGQTHDFKIVKIKAAEKRISLSIRAMDAAHSRNAMKTFKSSQPSSKTTLGDFMRAQGLGAKKKEAAKPAKPEAEARSEPEAAPPESAPSPESAAVPETEAAAETPAAEPSAPAENAPVADAAPETPAAPTASAEVVESESSAPTEPTVPAITEPVEISEPAETDAKPASGKGKAKAAKPSAKAAAKTKPKAKAKSRPKSKIKSQAKPKTSKKKKA